MTDDHRPRPHDHLVEPMYDALHEHADPEPPPEPRPTRLGCLLLVAPLIGVVLVVGEAALGGS